MERVFAELTQKQIRRGTHRSTRALEDAIRLYLKSNNEDPRPFVWVKTADEILASIARFACELPRQDTSGTSQFRLDDWTRLCDPARMWSPAAPLEVSSDQRRTLESWSRAHNTPQAVSTRARIILRAAEGRSNNAIANEFGITRMTV